MRPYLAVIKDSFREALASRVLWVLLVVISLALVGLAPVGWRRQLTAGVRMDDIRDVRGLAEMLVSAGQAGDDPVVRHIWRLLPERTQHELQQFVRSPQDNDMGLSSLNMQRQLADALNRLVQREDFFRPELWEEAPLSDEARAMLQPGPEQLSELERARLHRLALEAALAGNIRSVPSESVVFSYLAWDVGEPLALSDKQIEQGIAYALSAFISIFVGLLGIAAAILVTASIIPNMFDAGSVALLLSKPISRSLLFLSKFVGGCWFVAIVATYLIGGMWLVLGWRLDYWQHRLLLCIPIFLFLFVIYYSVSALAGLVWRNTIVAVMVTILFWLVCTMVGGAKVGVETLFVQPGRLVRIVPASADIVSLTQRGIAHRWDEGAGQWKEILDPDQASPGPPFGGGPPAVGPVYDPVHQRLLVVEPGWPQTRMRVVDPENEWAVGETVDLPRGTRQLLVEPDGHILVVANNGLLRWQGPAATPTDLPQDADMSKSRAREQMPAATPATPATAATPATPPGNVAASTLRSMAQAIVKGLGASAGQGEQFRAAGPEPPSSISGSVTISRDEGAVYCSDGKNLVRFERLADGTYARRQAVQLQEDQQQVVIAASRDHVLLAGEDGRVQLRDAGQLELLNQFTPHGRNQPRFATVAPDRRWFAVLFHNGRVWVLDTALQTAADPPVAGQGDISAVAFSGPNRLLVADRVNRVSHYQLPEGSLQQRETPPPTTVEIVYRYLINPIYTVFPKPGELDSSISYLLTERESVEIGPRHGRRGRNLDSAQLKLDPWAPVWSSLAFVGVMLVIACVYLHRQDF